MKGAKLVQWLGVRLEPSFCLRVSAKAGVSIAERSLGEVQSWVLGSQIDSWCEYGKVGTSGVRTRVRNMLKP